jgi:hypothetical protein
MTPRDAIPADRSAPPPRRVALAAAAFMLGSAVLLVGTAGRYGLTLDEPVYVQSADRVAQWFAGIRSIGLGESLHEDRLQRGWVFGRVENRNLPVPVLLACAGHQIGRHWLGPLSSYRLGHCLLMAVTVGILFGCLSRDHGWAAASVAAVSLLFMPRVFAHAHLNATDVPVSCFWMLALLAWLRGGSSWRGGLLAALACGLGLATKATFVLAPLLLAAWTILFRRWACWRGGLLVLLVSPVVMFALCPMWWPDPLRGVAYFRTVFRAEEIWKIEVYYLGRTYIAGVNPIPWHNGWVLLAVTTPPWTLALVLASVPQWLRTRDASAGLWLMGAALLPLLRMLPGTPAHDGVRLMLPSIFCLAPLAGLGFVHLVDWFRLSAAATQRPVSRCALVILLLAAGPAAVASMHPCEMSYYSELVGGLSGATRLGFEVSYWYDALTPGALAELQQHLPRGARVWVFPRYEGVPLLRRWGLWRPDLEEGDIGRADYLLLYTRKSRFYAIPGIEQTYQHGQPVWSYKRRGVEIVGLYKL